MDAIVDAAAGSVISIVLELSKGLYKEVNFLKGVDVGIQDLKNHLRHMKAALEVADDSRLEMNNVYLEWVSDVQELAYDAEDIIDTFVHTSGSWRRFPLRRFSRRTHKLGCQLESLKEDAEKIQRWRAHYADKSITTDRRKKKSLENLKEQREDSSYAHRTHEHMVGLEDTINNLAGKLTSGGSDRRFLMTILGMGGLGKTTLARRLYNKLSNGGHFEVRAWICVSAEEHDAKKMLQQLIKKIIPETESRKVLEDLSTSRHDMRDYLREYLKERSFLVVLDDVWGKTAWNGIHEAFPQNNINSRIIITTRKDDVAKMNGAYVHKLEHLNAEESWKLFCIKSFPYGNGCPPYLEGVGKDMVNKCHGLPLALVTLGGLLSEKSAEISEWEAVKVNLWDELKNHSEHINAVLTLSYMDLDYNLKRCFLCLGMYPEDSEISIFKLMLLWEAEGLIGQERGHKPEDTAKKYFEKLVGRSLIQEVRHSWNPPEYCRIHDLLRDLAIKKAEDIRFSAFQDATQTFGLLNKAQPDRRLVMSYHHPSTIPHDYTNGRLRTFRLREEEVSEVGQSSVSSYISMDRLLQSIDERFNLLRVLDIEVQGFKKTKLQLGKLIHLKYLGIKCFSVELPKTIGNMTRLKYLGINCHYVKLPKTIGNLEALETISISHNKYLTPAFMHVNLPQTMVNLQNLKHFDVCYFDCEGDWIGKLRRLETLELIESSKWCEIDASGLVNLRRLRVQFSEDVTTRFYLNFRGLTQLRTLFLVSGVARDLPPGFLSNIFKNCPSITHFTSNLRYEDAHNGDMFKFAKNLMHLELRLYRIDDIIMIPPTERFAELRYLKLRINCFDCTMIVMTCSEDGFPKLQTLIIDFVTDYDRTTDAHLKLEVAEGGMPLLTTLQVNLRERLTLMAPERLKKLITVAP